MNGPTAILLEYLPNSGSCNLLTNSCQMANPAILRWGRIAFSGGAHG
jgi:hypothetical protein